MASRKIKEIVIANRFDLLIALPPSTTLLLLLAVYKNDDKSPTSDGIHISLSNKISSSGIPGVASSDGAIKLLITWRLIRTINNIVTANWQTWFILLN